MATSTRQWMTGNSVLVLVCLHVYGLWYTCMLSADDVSRCMSSNGSVHVLCIVDGVDQVMTLLWMVNGAYLGLIVCPLLLIKWLNIKHVIITGRYTAGPCVKLLTSPRLWYTRTLFTEDGIKQAHYGVAGNGQQVGFHWCNELLHITGCKKYLVCAFAINE